MAETAGQFRSLSLRVLLRHLESFERRSLCCLKLICACLLHRARQHRDRFRRWPAVVLRENRRMRTKPLWCARWRYTFTET